MRRKDKKQQRIRRREEKRAKSTQRNRKKKKKICNSLKRIVQLASSHVDEMGHICLTEGCEEGAIRSHSQQRGQDLILIAEKNALNQDVVAMLCEDRKARWLIDLLGREEGRPRKEVEPLFDRWFSEVPIKKASTVPGYCNRCDTSAFFCVEQEMLNPGREDQAAALLRKALMREHGRKCAKMNFWKEVLSKSGEIRRHPFLEEAKRAVAGVKQFLSLDYPYYEHRSRLMQEEKEGLQYVWYTIEGNLGVSCAGVLPYHRWWGEQAFKYLGSQSPIPALFLNIIPRSEETHIVVSWHKDLVDDYLKKTWIWEGLCLDVSQDIEMTEFINRLLVKTEDTSLRPSLAQSVAEVDRKRFKQLFIEEIADNTSLLQPKAVQIVQAIKVQISKLKSVYEY